MCWASEFTYFSLFGCFVELHFNQVVRLTFEFVATMSFKLNDLKEIDNRIKYLIFGYNKQNMKSLSSYNLFQSIPCLVHALCILYYFETDKFQIFDPDSQIILTNQEKTVRIVSKKKGRFFIVGNVKLPSINPLNCTWRLKFDNFAFPASAFIALGVFKTTIQKAVAQCKNLHCYLCVNGTSWKYSDQIDLEEYGEAFVTNDIIDMQLIINDNKQQLIFTRNGKNLGVAFDNIQVSKDIYYRLRVGMDHCNGQMTLMSFKTH